jgi:hypothetical protein
MAPRPRSTASPGGRGGSPVIAKLCRLEVASVERTVYEEVLPPSPSPARPTTARPRPERAGPGSSSRRSAGPSSRSSPRSAGPWRGAGWASSLPGRARWRRSRVCRNGVRPITSGACGLNVRVDRVSLPIAVCRRYCGTPGAPHAAGCCIKITGIWRSGIWGAGGGYLVNKAFQVQSEYAKAYEAGSSRKRALKLRSQVDKDPGTR